MIELAREMNRVSQAKMLKIESVYRDRPRGFTPTQVAEELLRSIAAVGRVAQVTESTDEPQSGGLGGRRSGEKDPPKDLLAVFGPASVSPVSTDVLAVAVNETKRRVKRGELVQVNHRLPEDLHAQIKSIAAELGCTEADVVRAALWLALPGVRSQE